MSAKTSSTPAAAPSLHRSHSDAISTKTELIETELHRLQTDKALRGHLLARRTAGECLELVEHNTLAGAQLHLHLHFLLLQL